MVCRLPGEQIVHFSNIFTLSDTPIISLRDMVLPHIFKNVSLEEHYFYINSANALDYRHVRPHVHFHFKV